MHTRRCFSFAMVLLSGLTLLVWLGMMPRTPAAGDASAIRAGPAMHGPLLRLGIVPERDIFRQRQRYRALAEYLSQRLSRQVELRTVRTYQDVIEDFREKKVEAAFLGSLVAVLAVDQLDAQVLLKTQLPGGICSYRGVIVVPEDSPIQSVQDLRGKRIAMVRTTLAGHLFPMAEFSRHRWLDDPSAAPTPLWVGTHDEVIGAVHAGQADAGALKDLRLHELEKVQQPKLRLRRLAISQAVPENALVVRRDVVDPLGAELAAELMKMDSTPQGRAVLEQFGAERFVPCSLEEYSAIYEMSELLAARWNAIGLSGAPPVRRPGAATSRSSWLLPQAGPPNGA